MTNSYPVHFHKTVITLSLIAFILILAAILLATNPPLERPHSIVTCSTWYVIPDGRLRIMDSFCNANGRPDYVKYAIYVCHPDYVEYPDGNSAGVSVDFDTCLLQYVSWRGY